MFGYDLDIVQRGGVPKSAKKLRGLPNVVELVEPFDTDTYRAVYVANIEGKVYVLHCFKKKSKQGTKTPNSDIKLIRERLKTAIEDSEE